MSEPRQRTLWCLSLQVRLCPRAEECRPSQVDSASCRRLAALCECAAGSPTRQNWRSATLGTGSAGPGPGSGWPGWREGPALKCTLDRCGEAAVSGAGCSHPETDSLHSSHRQTPHPHCCVHGAQVPPHPLPRETTASV